MFAHIIGLNAEHGAIEIQVDPIAHIQAEGFVAVDGHTGRDEFLRIGGILCEEVHNLSALNVDDRDALTLGHVDGPACTGANDVFL